MRALRSKLMELEQELLHAQRRGAQGDPGSGSGGGGAGALSGQLASLKARVADLEAENVDLKTELNAFDPAFFEEIEDLKHSHHTLQGKCAGQERSIRRLQEQLQLHGIAPPSM